ncbi:MAG: hypothetical protein ACP5HQ_06815 [Thermoprotei archaeon]
MKKEFAIAAVVSTGLAIAILSLPDVMEPIAHEIIHALGYIWPVAVLLIGVIHGLKPDEHTWPITISYAMMQESLKKAMLSTAVFAGALTLVWAALSALTSQVLPILSEGVYDPLVSVIVGLTMLGVALFLKAKERKKGRGEEGVQARADYRAIWIHGVAAAFGGDFFVVLFITTIIHPIIPQNLGFAVGLLFGLGSWLAQSAVVALAYKGLVNVAKDLSILARAGVLSLAILGAFIIGIGVTNAVMGDASPFAHHAEMHGHEAHMHQGE